MGPQRTTSGHKLITIVQYYNTVITTHLTDSGGMAEIGTAFLATSNPECFWVRSNQGEQMNAQARNVAS